MLTKSACFRFARIINKQFSNSRHPRMTAVPNIDSCGWISFYLPLLSHPALTLDNSQRSLTRDSINHIDNGQLHWKRFKASLSSLRCFRTRPVLGGCLSAGGDLSSHQQQHPSQIIAISSFILFMLLSFYLPFHSSNSPFLPPLLRTIDVSHRT